MNKKNKVDNKFYTYGIILIIILAIVLFLFYKENSKGFLVINTDVENIKIFVDNEERESLGTNEIKLSEGSHTIVISKNGFWPWIKEVDVKKQQTFTISPFFIPEQTGGFIINKNDPEYYNIISLFETQKTHIDWEKDENTPEIILNFESEIKASDFYKDRENIIVIAVQNGIYALEINSSSTPNFQPIYKGTNPIFVKKDNDTLYVRDGEVLMEVAY